MKSIKNNIKNFAKVSFLGLALLGSQSCENVLDETVISAIGNDYINTPKGLDDAVAAAYTSMRTWYGTEAGNNFTIFGTDTYTNGADGSWKFMNTYTNDFGLDGDSIEKMLYLQH